MGRPHTYANCNVFAFNFCLFSPFLGSSTARMESSKQSVITQKMRFRCLIRVPLLTPDWRSQKPQFWHQRGISSITKIVNNSSYLRDRLKDLQHTANRSRMPLAVVVRSSDCQHMNKTEIGSKRFEVRENTHWNITVKPGFDIQKSITTFKLACPYRLLRDHVNLKQWIKSESVYCFKGMKPSRCTLALL